jgi:hypothetical protein
MKKYLILTFLVCLTTSLKAQIKSFNIGKEKVAIAYLGYTPGGSYSGSPITLGDRGSFFDQESSWLEMGGEYPIWKGLNVSAGLTVPLNYKSHEKFGWSTVSESEWININSGTQQYPDGTHIVGPVMNAGLSYSFSLGKLLLIPGLGLESIVDYGLFYDPSLSVVFSPKYERYADPYLSLNAAYKNYLVGIKFQDIGDYVRNRNSVAIRIGYAFPLKQTKMNF